MLWLIYNDKANLFWNNDTGWGSLETAEKVTTEEMQNSNLPMEGRWVREDSHEARTWKDPDT